MRKKFTGGFRFADAYPEEARLVGAVIIEWNRIEMMLVMIIAAASGEETAAPWDEAMEILANRQRLRALRMAVLASANDAQTRSRYTAMLEEAGRCLTLRNKYAHAVVMVAPEKGPGIVRGAKFATVNEVSLLSVDELRNTIKRFAALEVLQLDLLNETMDRRAAEK